MFSISRFSFISILLRLLSSTNGSSFEESERGGAFPFLGIIEPYDESTNVWFDYLFANLRHDIAVKGLNSLALPSDSDTFSATLFNSTMDGYVFVGDGKVSGLQTIHRSGNMSLHFVSNETEKEIVVGGGAALIDLEAIYNTEFELGPFKSHFGVKLSISYIALEFLTDIFVRPEEIVFEHCDIMEINTIHIHLSGMGIFDSRIYNLLGNALLEILEEPLTNVLSSVACKLLQAALRGDPEPASFLIYK